MQHVVTCLQLAVGDQLCTDTATSELAVTIHSCGLVLISGEYVQQMSSYRGVCDLKADTSQRRMTNATSGVCYEKACKYHRTNVFRRHQKQWSATTSCTARQIPHISSTQTAPAPPSQTHQNPRLQRRLSRAFPACHPPLSLRATWPTASSAAAWSWTTSKPCLGRPWRTWSGMKGSENRW